MFVTTIRNRQKGKVYETHLIRRTYRKDGKVKNETVANITALPKETREVIRRSLKGERLVPVGQFEILASYAHGDVALVRGVLRDCGLQRAIHSRDVPNRRLVEAMLVARVLAPMSKLATTRWWLNTTLPAELGVEDATEDDLYAALDWLGEQQDRIENKLAKKHLADGSLMLYDVSSSYLTGRHCPLGARGHSRDGKSGTLQVVYGVICNRDGLPLAVEVYKGNTNDTTTVLDQIRKAQKRFGLKHLVFVGDRGMIKQTRVNELREMDGVDWISALGAPQVQKLRDAGDLQLGLFDERDLGEISSALFPDERLIVCRNPMVAGERKRKRDELLDATEARLDKVREAVQAGRMTKAGAIGERVGRAWGKQKMRKHFTVVIEDGHFSYTRDTENIEREASLDGLYVIRTSLQDAQAHPAEDVVRHYKRLAWVERVFRVMKTTQLLVRPIYHRLEGRVKAHIFLCMLAAHVVWHLEHRLESLLFRDEGRAEQKELASPVSPLPRSEQARRKDLDHTSDDDYPLHSLKTLLADMATLQRHTVRMADGGDTWEQLSKTSQFQRRVFELAGVKGT